MAADLKRMHPMAMNATRIADVVYDAAHRHYHGAVEFFSPGLPAPCALASPWPRPQRFPTSTWSAGLFAPPNAKFCSPKILRP